MLLRKANHLFLFAIYTVAMLNNQPGTYVYFAWLCVVPCPGLKLAHMSRQMPERIDASLSGRVGMDDPGII